jgi:hypothetical protein
MKLFSVLVSASIILTTQAGGDDPGVSSSQFYQPPFANKHHVITEPRSTDMRRPNHRCHRVPSLQPQLARPPLGSASRGHRRRQLRRLGFPAPRRAGARLPGPVQLHRPRLPPLQRRPAGLDVRAVDGRRGAECGGVHRGRSRCVCVPDAGVRQCAAVFGVQCVAGGSLVHNECQWEESDGSAWVCGLGDSGICSSLRCGDGSLPVKNGFADTVVQIVGAFDGFISSSGFHFWVFLGFESQMICLSVVE